MRDDTRRTVLASASLAALTLSVAGEARAAPRDLGFNVHQSPTVGLDATRDAGVGWVRIDFNWLDAQPRSAAAYDWTRFDALIDGAIARKLRVLAVVGYTPAWASQADAKGGGSANDVPKAGTFGPFVTAVVNRYKAKVTHYEIWNEPNLEQFFEGSPRDYIDRVFLPGADAVHAACPACKVVGPGLASIGNEYGDWLDQVLSAGKSKLDIVSGHIYAGFPPPAGGGGAGTTSDSFFNKLERHRVVELGGVKVYEGSRSFKEVMDKHGVTAPFWITETGREATAGDATQEEAQRVYYRQVLEVMLTRPWWTGTIFYEAFDEPPAPYTWGIVVSDPAAPGGYRAKPALAFLKKVTSSQPELGGNKTDCDDGLDNDLDGRVDFPSDRECASATGASEGTAPAPGTGNNGGPTGRDAGVPAPPDEEDASPGASPPAAATGDAGGCSTSGAGSRLGAAFAAFSAFALALAMRRRRRPR
ncbi:MAG: hypothetical protein IPF92_16875 [Myxococcales bacterium]|jgi:hypothetical protein|nr:hypothetical protein [Myxococcales bacterium]MBL0195476.1 hypothetical protein [Myxococcales bacterium]HQY62501.1 hypothetical protein [Polyangiaceae bacterium]